MLMFKNYNISEKRKCSMLISLFTYINLVFTIGLMEATNEQVQTSYNYVTL